MQKIVFHCSPPAYLILPSPALSVLKGYLNHYGYRSDVIYWNLLFYNIQKKFIFTNKSLTQHPNPLLVFVNYIAIESKDEKLIRKVKAALISYSPEHLANNFGFYESHMLAFKKEVDNIISTIIEKYNFSEALYFGFTLKFEQWVFAFLLASILKKKFPSIPIIIGGINSKEAACSFLRNFDPFDIALWGEGETSLLKLTQKIENNIQDYSDIANIAYKKEDKISVSQGIRQTYIDLSSSYHTPDYTDYFEQKKNCSTLYDTAITIEFSRGCHWNRCHFCYLNAGYKYRQKSIQKIKDEIVNNIKRYSVFQFAFTDNDLVGEDLVYFDRLLDTFIEIKYQYPLFNIVIAEIVTKELDKTIIQKMTKASLHMLQIGYENVSDSLLRKIEKINTFASNILFLKFAQQQRMSIIGLNVLYNLFEETDEDIIEAICNLRFLRFMRAYFTVKHNISPLTINGTSRYCNKFKYDRSEWKPTNTTSFYLRDYWKEGTDWDILDFSKVTKNDMWLDFEKTDKYYCNNKHTYSLKKIGSNVIFKEYKNNKEDYSIEMDFNSIEYQTLLLSNDQVISIDFLTEKLNTDILSTNNIKTVLDVMFDKGLIFYNKDYSEVVSVINTDLLIEKDHSYY